MKIVDIYNRDDGEFIYKKVSFLSSPDMYKEEFNEKNFTLRWLDSKEMSALDLFGARTDIDQRVEIRKEGTGQYFQRPYVKHWSMGYILGRYLVAIKFKEAKECEQT